MAFDNEAAMLALESSVAVFVLAGTTPGDYEFIQLKPIPNNGAADAVWAELKTRWPGRGLRPIGAIGLCGLSPRVKLKEPLEPDQVSALAAAFLAYLSAIYADKFAEYGKQCASAQREAEIVELDIMYSFPDPRPN